MGLFKENSKALLSGQGVRETLTGKGNAIPHPHHLPKPSLVVNRQNHPEGCSLLIQSLGEIKIARLMLQKTSIDGDDVFSQQLAFKSPVPPTFPTELNNIIGIYLKWVFFSVSIFLWGLCELIRVGS